MAIQQLAKYTWRLRRNHNLTQEELAGKLGTSIDTVQRWEKQGKALSIEQLGAMLVLLNGESADVDLLLGSDLTDDQAMGLADMRYRDRFIAPAVAREELAGMLPDPMLQVLDILRNHPKYAPHVLAYVQGIVLAAGETL